jgi:hypothetical protein
MGTDTDLSLFDLFGVTQALPSYETAEPEAFRKNAHANSRDTTNRTCHQNHHQDGDDNGHSLPVAIGKKAEGNKSELSDANAENPSESGLLSSAVGGRVLPGTGIEPALPLTGTRPST